MVVDLSNLEDKKIMDIKLKSVEVKRDYSLNNTLKVYFSDYNISVIYGENGCGKTTILRLINAFLAQNDSVLSQEKVLLMSMTYQFEGVETKVLVEKKERTESIKDEDGNIMEQVSIYYDWSVIANQHWLGCQVFCSVLIEELQIIHIYQKRRFMTAYLGLDIGRSLTEVMI